MVKNILLTVLVLSTLFVGLTSAVRVDPANVLVKLDNVSPAVINLQGVDPAIFESPAFATDLAWVTASHFKNVDSTLDLDYTNWLIKATQWMNKKEA